MKKVKFLALIIIFQIQITAIAQWPWEKISSISYAINDPQSIDGNLFAYSGKNLLISQNKGDSWAVLKNLNTI